MHNKYIPLEQLHESLQGKVQLAHDILGDIAEAINNDYKNGGSEGGKIIENCCVYKDNLEYSSLFKTEVSQSNLYGNYMINILKNNSNLFLFDPVNSDMEADRLCGRKINYA